MDDGDAAGPQSLIVVVSRSSSVPYSTSIIEFEIPQVNNPEYASSSLAIETDFSAHIPYLPLAEERPITWAGSLPLESCTEDLYFLPDWTRVYPEKQNISELPGFIFNLSSKKCKIIKPPYSFKYSGYAVTMGDHIYFMAQPCWANRSPVPHFERYDTLSQEWEVLEPLPILTKEFIHGTAVLDDDDTILFNIDGGRSMWAYKAGRDYNWWYPVKVLNNLCYNIVGTAVVLNKIIYALTEYCESLVALTVKSQEIEGGDLVFTCDLHKVYEVPGMKKLRDDIVWDSFDWSRHLVHLGKDKNFCVVQSCNDDVMDQYIYLTYIEVVSEEEEEKLIVRNRCVHNFKLNNRAECFDIEHCFCMPKRVFKEGGNREQEAEIVTLPPELLQFQLKYSEQGGSVSQTSRCRDDEYTGTRHLWGDVLKKSSASSESRVDADTKTRQVREDVPKKSSASSQSRDDVDTKTRHTICVRNLPLDANSRQIINRFKRFGPIKSVGIRTYFDNIKREFCFGHVDFESATSKQKAIQASTIVIGGRIAVIEEVRGTGDSNRSSSRSKTSVGKDYRNRPEEGGELEILESKLFVS